MTRASSCLQTTATTAEEAATKKESASRTLADAQPLLPEDPLLVAVSLAFVVNFDGHLVISDSGSPTKVPLCFALAAEDDLAAAT